MSIGTLDVELQTYTKKRDELLANYSGQFALIRDGELCGTYSSQSDAIAEGYRKFGNVPFLVKEIVKVETSGNFTSNHLAV